MTGVVVTVVVAVIFVFAVAGLPYVIIKGRRRRAHAMAERTFDDIEPIDLGDDGE